ncbi:MAG: hypothetical protein LUB59_07860 [Candidatus Gastranaerophilales bacterium]|nr:hypothetical protein [Candidatus Gastranaerophilales bacterium]
MIDDVRNISNKQVSTNETGKTNGSNPAVSFRGNPNAVDTTPESDTYQPQYNPQAEESSDSPLKTVTYTIPTWFVLNKGTNLFNKACGGEYEKSLVGRLGKFGDRISDTKLVKNSFVDNLKIHGRSIKKNIQSFIDKHPMLTAMQKTPTKPECPMVTGFLETQSEADIKEASGKLTKFIDKNPKSLQEAGATKDEIKALKSKFGTDIFGRIKNSEAAIQEFQLTKMGGPNIMTSIAAREKALAIQMQRYQQAFNGLPANDPGRAVLMKRIVDIEKLRDGYRTTVLKNLKLQTSGLSKKAYEAIQKDPVKHVKKLERALTKAQTLSPKLAENLNKLKSIHVPKSALGKLFPKLAKLGLRGLTFGGGTFNTLFIAFLMAGTVKNAVEAPKDKKTGTIAHGLLENMSWVVSMPLALGAMHAVNGIKNTGISKDKVDKYAKNLKAFNEKVKTGKLSDKAAYDMALKKLEASKGVAGKQGLFTKIMTKAAKFLSISLEQIAPYKKATKNLSGSAKWEAKLGNIKRAMPNFLRNCVGYPLRFAIYMFVFAPLVEKLFSGVTTMFFGKAWDPEEEKEKKAKEAERRAALYPGPSIVPNPQALEGVGTIDLNTLSDNNLIKQKISGIKPQQLYYAPYSQPNGNNGINAASNQPFMPPVQNGNQNVNQNNPNESEYDTVPRSYVPNVDLNSPLPYSDPMANPASDRNYYNAQALAVKSDKLADDVEAFLNGN